MQLIILLAILLVLGGMMLLFFGYKGIAKNEVGSKEYNDGKNKLKGGIIVFICIGILLVIGFSICLSIM